MKVLMILCLYSRRTTSCDYLPKIQSYTKISNPSVKQCNHGGIVVYVKNNIFKNVFNITHNECFLTFRLDIAPQYIFGGVYIQPENSRYFNMKMFADLDTLLVNIQENGYIPFIDGDFNARLGDLNKLETCWIYEDNCDVTSNRHGRMYISDICNRNKMFPIYLMYSIA